jgi:hypothetical protein
MNSILQWSRSNFTWNYSLVLYSSCSVMFICWCREVLHSWNIFPWNCFTIYQLVLLLKHSRLNAVFLFVFYLDHSAVYANSKLRKIKFHVSQKFIYLTVQLCIILVGEQLDAQFLLWYVYLNPLHVSSNSVLILRRTIVLTQQLV